MIQLRPKTAGGWLVDQLRDMIISGELEAGLPVRQEELAERFQVSRMPVRQALDVLAAEGWIDQRPHRGAIVRPLDSEDALELFEIRASLETLAIERSFPRLSDEQIANIVRAGQAMLDDDAGNPLLHQAFHVALYTAAGPRLLRLVMRELEAARRYLQFESGALAVFDQDRSEHEGLIEAARARDVAAGVGIIKAHVLEGGRGIAASLRAREIGQT